LKKFEETQREVEAVKPDAIISCDYKDYIIIEIQCQLDEQLDKYYVIAVVLIFFAT
jgi:hypothetical protein